jgi:hypothetical protein
LWPPAIVGWGALKDGLGPGAAGYKGNIYGPAYRCK